MERNDNSRDEQNSTMITDKKMSKLEVRAEEFFMKGNSDGNNEKGKPGVRRQRNGSRKPFLHLTGVPKQSREEATGESGQDLRKDTKFFRIKTSHLLLNKINEKRSQRKNRYIC